MVEQPLTLEVESMPSGGSGVTENNGSAVLYTVAPERRINAFKPELRSASDGSGPKHIVGYASVFDRLSRNLGGFVERVNQRAFDASRAIGFEGAVCRWNHNDDFLLGTVAARTCLIDVDGTGMLYDVVPPSTTAGNDVMILMGRGDVTSSSFAFRAAEDDWALSDFGMPLRTLLSMEVIDVAPVTTPAYPDATSSLRSVDGAVHSLAARFDADPEEIRSLLDAKQAKKLFTRSDMITPSAAPVIPAIPEEDRMSLDEQRMALYEEELRAKYSADQLKAMLAKGHAMKNAKGAPSYPIADEEDLHNAIHAVGRGGASHDAIKAHIKKRAAAMGKTSMLPDTWDGGAPEKKSAEDEDLEARAKAPVKADVNEDEENDEDTDEENNAAPEEDAEERAAKASYDDLATCAECGAKNQHGKFCTECGQPMVQPGSGGPGKHCPDCGSKMPSKRDEHKCGEEVRDEAATTEPVGDGSNAKLPGHELASSVSGEDQLASIGLNRRYMELKLRENKYDPFLAEDGDE
jgi:HK97 family phage prohead protease